MRMIIICPACNNGFEVEFAIMVKTRVRIGTNKISETKKIETVKISNIRILTLEESRILKRIRPYIKPGITMVKIMDLLIKKFNVKKSRVRHMVSIIKKAYGIRIESSAKGAGKRIKAPAGY